MATTELTSGVWNSSLSTARFGGSHRPAVHYLSHLYKVKLYLWYIYAPIILLFGNFGNVMTLIIMRKMKSGDSVVNIYFSGLAIVDLITLDINLLGEWMGTTFVLWLKYESNAVCKITNWLSTCSTTISAWFLVCMTVHRALSVVWPHRVNLLCTRRRVTALLLGIAAFFAVVYSHNLYGYNLVYVGIINRHLCLMMKGSYSEFIENVFTYIDLVLYSLLPFVCLILANTVLVWKLRASVRETRHTLAEGRSDHQNEGRQKTARAVTLTVILVSAAFIVLTLPVSLYYVLVYVAVVTHVSAYHHAMLYVVDAVTYLLMFSNSAINFYLYCLTGTRFREGFIKIIFCGKVKKPLAALSVSGDSSKKWTCGK